MRSAGRLAPLSLLFLMAACPRSGHIRPEPIPAPVSILTALVVHVRETTDHVQPLAVGPFHDVRPLRLELRVSQEFEAAYQSLRAQLSRTPDPIPAEAIAGVPVRHDGTFDAFDATVRTLVRFSPIGFDQDSSRAVVLVQQDCGVGCGSLAVATLRRSGGRWAVTAYHRISEHQP